MILVTSGTIAIILNFNCYKNGSTFSGVTQRKYLPNQHFSGRQIILEMVMCTVLNAI